MNFQFYLQKGQFDKSNKPLNFGRVPPHQYLVYLYAVFSIFLSHITPISSFIVLGEIFNPKTLFQFLLHHRYRLYFLFSFWFRVKALVFAFFFFFDCDWISKKRLFCCMFVERCFLCRKILFWPKDIIFRCLVLQFRFCILDFLFLT